MLLKTSTTEAPWTIVRANDKKEAHLNLIRHLLLQVNYAGKNKRLLKPNADVIFTFNQVRSLEK
jgi:hypothetical protein